MLKTKLNTKSQSEPHDRKYRAEIQPYSLRLKTAAKALDVGEGKLRTLIEDKEIAAIKSGKCLLITTQEIERYLASLPRAELKSRMRTAR